jgi:regulator of protease activity HflC (stomatin/prohibitin superfamily)
MLFPVLVVLVLALAFISASVRILPEYERGVVFRLGRVLGRERGPGLILLIPFVDKMARLSIQVVTMNIDPQDVITKDNVTLKVNAVLYFRVIDPTKAVVNVQNYFYATQQKAQTHLRSSLGEHTMDQLLTERERINDKIQRIIDEDTFPWGIKVESVEIKDIDLPAEMQRAMAKEAESERTRRAKIIAAEGEFQAATKLREAADQMAENPVTIQLRYMQTLSDMSRENNTTIVFPIPLEMFNVFKGQGQAKS